MSETVVPIRRALFSVYDKRGLPELAQALARAGVELLASGGTQAALVAGGLAVTEVAEYTGSPEILGGRVKTLHPKIHAGILARRDVALDVETLARQGISPIDLVVVNLYPFEATVARPGATFADAVENIDIGGPSLIRGAAKNHSHVAVLTNPDDYGRFIASLREAGGTTLDERRRLALAAFRHTAAYDRAIADYFERFAGVPSLEPVSFPEVLELEFQLRQPLRYGENPHQQAAFYVDPGARGPNLATATLLHGKELSYNNLLDLDSALRLVRAFASPAACILKHNNPCGAAIANELSVAFERAYEGDPTSAFGGIVGFNRTVDRAAAERMCQPGRFLEAILAPGFEEDALEWLRTRPTWKNSVRLLDLGAPIEPTGAAAPGFDLRRVEGGLLVQDWDGLEPDPAAGSIPTRRATRKGRAGRPGVRVEGVRLGPLQRDRARERGANRGRWRGPDEPARFGADRDRQGGPARPWRSPRLRRVFPIPRRPRSGRRRRRDRHDPARRFPARRPDDRGLQRARHRHDLHRPPPLPALIIENLPGGRIRSTPSLRTPPDGASAAVTVRARP